MLKNVFDKLKGWLVESEDDENETEIKTIIPETKIEPKVVAEVKPEVHHVAKKEVKVEPVKETAPKQTAQPKQASQPKQPVEPKPVEKVEEKKAEPVAKTSFLKVTEPTKEEKKAEAKSAREAYRPAQVISPIFGNSKVDSYNIGSSQLEYDEEKSTTSVIGTVFSPMYGKDIAKVSIEDEVDEKVANMTTKDFLSKPKKESVKQIVPPVVKQVIEKPAVSKKQTEKTIDEENYENLSLFD